MLYSYHIMEEASLQSLCASQKKKKKKSLPSTPFFLLEILKNFYCVTLKDLTINFWELCNTLCQG